MDHRRLRHSGRGNMEVKTSPELVKNFWPQYRKRIIAGISLFQLIALAVVIGVLYYYEFFLLHLIASLSIVLAQIVVGVLSSLFIYRLITRPLTSLLAAVVHVSGEPSSTPPPSPNDTYFTKLGLRPALQTIYELASQDNSSAPVLSSDGLPSAQIATATRTSLEAALDETSCGFISFGTDRKISFANKAAPIRVTPEGVQLLDIIFNGNDTLEAWWNECEQTTVRAEHTWSRVSNKLPDSEDRRFFDIIATYDKGAVNEVVLTLIDQTARYSIGEQDLDFIAFAAHELRGPITVIRGYLDVLQGELTDVLKDDQHELFRRLTVSANRLSGYINNILNTAKYDRRHLKMHLSETSVAEVYDTISDDMQLRANAQNRLISVTIPQDLPNVAADTGSLGEVLGNLIDNAIKYSNEGGAIAVVASSRGNAVDIAVQDQGIGMPGNVVGSLFQKFYRSHRSRETVAGTGIGLYISKAIVESHGGTINVRSEEGKGSTFTVTLPTYEVVAEKLKAGDNGNESIMTENKDGWIKNHAMYRG